MAIINTNEFYADVQELTAADEHFAAKEALALLALEEGLHLYRAAHPGYPGNFTRDGIIAASIGGDKHALRAQVAYTARNIGTKNDPITGEETGKAHHELPTVEINGASSAYNACDTTAMFLSSIAWLSENGEPELTSTLAEEIELGLTYIKRHVRNGLFIEDPSFSGAEKYGLRVTYWKDSVLNHKERQEPDYPIVYSLAHFQNADALMRIGRVLGRQELLDTAEEMYLTGMDKLWRGDHFVAAMDNSGDIDPKSTDSLYALLYIPSEKLQAGQAISIEAYMKDLITPWGYRTGLPEVPDSDPYHTDFVWTHEQAKLHAAARKHGLEEAQGVTERIVAAMAGRFPELIHAETGKHAGNDPQLWAVQTFRYFQNPASAIL